ncbi:glycine betaine ABC transporter substrate-binding protein, partial [Streptomyces sp. NPDC005921]
MAQHWRAGAAGLAVLGLTLTACGGAKVGDSSSAGSKSSDGKCGTFNLAVNPWVGYEADAAVVAYVAQHDLGCTVNKKDLKEEIAWQGFGTGEVDAVLENWGHDDLKKKYITGQETAVEAGSRRRPGRSGRRRGHLAVDHRPGRQA